MGVDCNAPRKNTSKNGQPPQSGDAFNPTPPIFFIKNTTMHYCVSYDISDARLRRRISKWCRLAGLRRLQRSVFVGFIPNNLLQELEEQVQAEIPVTDRFCIITLDHAAWKTMRLLGDMVPQGAFMPPELEVFF
jgi:CRISPR-associated protein Cas2